MKLTPHFLHLIRLPIRLDGILPRRRSSDTLQKASFKPPLAWPLALALASRTGMVGVNRITQVVSAMRTLESRGSCILK